MQRTPVNGFRYQEVAGRIRAMIESGALATGDRLPSLRGLSRTMGVSISTVSQAYLELERQGLIKARPRSGFFVRPARRMPAPARRAATPPQAKSVNRSQLINTVLESLGRRDLLPLGVICPSPRLLPGKALARLMGQALRDAAADPSQDDPLDYGSIQGLPGLRRSIAFRAMERGEAVNPDDVLITCGAMEALYISLRCLTRPGDAVCIQSPTYYCFLQLLETLGLRAIEIPSHPDAGIHPADLREALDTFDIRCCVFCPNFNNPDGSLTPDDAKAEIADMLGGRGIPLVEDDVYGDLHFGPQRPGTCKAHDGRGLVILCSSFSKTLAPGWRVGWMTPGRFMDKAKEIKATTNVCTASPTQAAVGRFLRQGLYERHLARLRAAIARQAETLRHHVALHFPAGTRATSPSGGSVIWLELPGVDAVDYFFAAREMGIGIAPGPVFSTLDRYNNFVRLSCGGVWSEAMEQGIRTLGRLAREMAK